MGTIRLEMTLTINGGEQEVDVEIDYDYTAGEAAVLSGPWENSHPGSAPEIQLNSCTDWGGTIDYSGFLTASDKEYIEDKICELEQDAEYDPPESDDPHD